MLRFITQFPSRQALTRVPIPWHFQAPPVGDRARARPRPVRGPDTPLRPPHPPARPTPSLRHWGHPTGAPRPGWDRHAAPAGQNYSSRHGPSAHGTPGAVVPLPLPPPLCDRTLTKASGLSKPGRADIVLLPSVSAGMVEQPARPAGLPSRAAAAMLVRGAVARIGRCCENAALAAGGAERGERQRPQRQRRAGQALWGREALREPGTVGLFHPQRDPQNHSSS